MPLNAMDGKGMFLASTAVTELQRFGNFVTEMVRKITLKDFLLVLLEMPPVACVHCQAAEGAPTLGFHVRAAQ